MDGPKVLDGPNLDVQKIADELKGIGRQVGGDHYRRMKIQPVTFVLENGLGYVEGCVVKYVSRWRAKNGVEDLRKARHFLDLLIEFEEGREEGDAPARDGSIE